MHVKDIQITRLTRNLRELAEVSAKSSAAQRNRLRAAVKDARDRWQDELDVIEPKKRSGQRGRAAVVSWDLTHNPVAVAIYSTIQCTSPYPP